MRRSFLPGSGFSTSCLPGSGFSTSCLPGSGLVGPACRAGRRGLPRPVRRGSQRIAYESAASRQSAVVWCVLWCELGSASPNVHSGRMDLLWCGLVRPACRAAVLVRPACRAGRRGLPRPVRRGSQRIAYESVASRESTVVWCVLRCELGSASPNVHSGRMDLLEGPALETNWGQNSFG